MIPNIKKDNTKRKIRFIVVFSGFGGGTANSRFTDTKIGKIIGYGCRRITDFPTPITDDSGIDRRFFPDSGASEPFFSYICKSSKGSYLMNSGLDNFISNFKNLYERGLAFAKAFVFDANLAEDITSESLIVLWNKLREGQHIEQPQIYLFAIIRNKSLESLRNQKSALLSRNVLTSESERDYNLRIKSAEACDPKLLYSKEVQSIIKDCLKDLGSQTRAVFILSRYEGLSNKDIATKLGLSPKTVEYHITKALKFFKEKLKDYLPLLLFFCINL